MGRFISLVVFALWVQLAAGQVIVGPRAGLNMSDIRELTNPFSSANDFFNPKFSYHLGGFVKVPTTERVFLQGEVIYSSKGSRLRDQFGNRTNLNLNYISLPMLAGVQFNDWSVFFGPETSINVGKNDSNSRFDVGLILGAQYYLGEKTQLGFRFVQGLTALNDLGIPVDSGSTGPDKLRNQVWQLSLSYDVAKF